jgi:hypothetical protein
MCMCVRDCVSVLLCVLMCMQHCDRLAAKCTTTPAVSFFVGDLEVEVM